MTKQQQLKQCYDAEIVILPFHYKVQEVIVLQNEYISSYLSEQKYIVY